MTFKKTVLAYLTGWVIAQSIFNRVWHRIMRNAIEADQNELFARVGGIVADKVFEVLDSSGRAGVTWRLATQDELDRTGSSDRANLIDGAGAVLRGGELIGLCDEYGTCIWSAPGVNTDTIERLNATAGELT